MERVLAAALLCAVLSPAVLVRGALGDASGHFATSLAAVQEDSAGVYSAWLAHFRKAGSLRQEEYSQRLHAFVATVQRAAERRGSGQVVLNSFADMSLEAFRADFLGQRSRSELPLMSRQNEPYKYENINPPMRVDWREKGIIGPIKSQHVNKSACGCCWTFATTGGVECVYAMSSGKSIALSEQQLIDCDRGGPWFDLGCDGGDFEGGVLYATRHGLDTEEDYPYKAVDSVCDRKKENRSVVFTDGFGDVPRSNETALMQAVSQHPVVVAVCCGEFLDAWHAYTGGFLDVPGHPGGCTSPKDHAVVVVGYGTTPEGRDYWVLKNSWSLDWGERGYFYVDRGLGGKGAWSVAAAPGYPIVKGVNSAADPIIDFGSWAALADVGTANTGILAIA